MTVTHDAVAAIRQLQVLPLGDEGIGFSNQHLGQHPTSAFACDFAQGIIDSIRLTERDDGGISRHGVSLLSGGSGRLDTRLDTPPSIKRRHPDSRLARGLVTSDAGALLLGATDRAIDLVDRFASCFHDERRPELIEHSVATLVGQRVFGIALGYEDLNDHDELRHDPMMAVLAGKLEAGREECAPVAGKSTLNRLELSKLEPTRYHKISHNPVAIKNLPVDVFLEAHARPPKQIILDLDATDDPLHGEQEGRFFHGNYDGYCYLPLYIFCGRHLLAAKLRPANIDGAAGSIEEGSSWAVQGRQSRRPRQAKGGAE